MLTRKITSTIGRLFGRTTSTGVASANNSIPSGGLAVEALERRVLLSVFGAGLDDAGGPYEISEGEPLWLDASAVLDLESIYFWTLDSVPLILDAANVIPFVPWEQLEALGVRGDGSALSLELTVLDSAGVVTASVATDLVIHNVAPNANVGGPYVLFEGQDLVLEGSGQDPNANDELVLYEWDVDDDGAYDNGTGPSLVIPWAAVEAKMAATPGMDSDGTPMVFGLQVTDWDGGVGTSQALVFVVDNIAPLVSTDSLYEINEGDTLELRASAADAGGDPLTFTWDLDADGVYDDAAGASVDVAWATLEQLGLPSNGTVLSISVKVEDSDGGVAATGADLIINNLAPIADAGGTNIIAEAPAYVIKEGQSLWVDASGTTDPDANDNPNLIYAWDINNDGSLDYFAGSNPIVQIPWQVLEDAGVSGNGLADPITLGLLTSDQETNGQILLGSAEVTLIVLNVDPVADAGGPYVIDEGLPLGPLTLDGSGSTDPNANDILTYDWDLNDDGVYDIIDQMQPSVTWATLHDTFGLLSDGTTLVVQLRVSDNHGGQDIDRSLLLVVNNLTPSVDAGGPYEINEGDSLQLEGSGSDPGDDPLTFLWDLDNDGVFDDAATTTPLVPWDNLKLLNIKTNGHNNTIALLVDDGEGHGVNVATAILTVNNVAPTVDAGPNLTINEGDTAHLFGSFTDPYGDLDSVYSFDWDFGDGSAVPIMTEHAAHTYVDDTGGPFTAILQVTDKDGGTGSDSAVVTVLNVAPDVDAGEDKVATEEHLVAFSGQFTDPGLADTHTIHWDFGDGDVADGTLDVTHEYADDGTYTVTLTVTDDDGGTGQDTLTVIVFNEGPWVYAGPHHGIDEGDTVTFDQAEFSDVLADIPPASITWSFGDGTGTTGILNPSHTYVDDGFYTAILTVDDGDGGVVSDQVAIHVENVAPLNVDAGPDTLINLGTTFAFSGSFDDPGILDTHTVLWTFGDGFHQMNTLTPTHEYLDSGIYTVALSVTDDDGAFAMDVMQMEVQEVLFIENNATFLHTEDGLATIELRGPGELVQVTHVNHTGIDLKGILLENTTEDSSLIIKTFGQHKSSVRLGDLVVNSSLGKLKASTTILKGDVMVNTGSLGNVRLAGFTEDASIVTGVGGINSVKVKGDISGDILSATSIGKVISTKGSVTAQASIVAAAGDINLVKAKGDIAGDVEASASIGKITSRKGGLTDQASVVALGGDIGRAVFGTGLDGMLLASGNIGKVVGRTGALTGTVRAGTGIGRVKFDDIAGATISSGGDIGAVLSSNSIIDSVLLAGFDIGPDGLPGTGDEVFNTSAGTIGRIRVNSSTGVFHGTSALAGVKPFDFDVATGTWTMLAPAGQIQELALFGEIGSATVGQVFFNGDPTAGITGLFAATEDIVPVNFVEVTASGAADFEVKSTWP